MDKRSRKKMTMHKLTYLEDTRGRSWNWRANEFNKWTRGQKKWWRCTSWRTYTILGAILEIDVQMNSINGQEVKKSDDDAQADVLIWYSGHSWICRGNVFNKWTRGQENWWRCTSTCPYMILGDILEIDAEMNSINGQEVKKSDDDAEADFLIW